MGTLLALLALAGCAGWNRDRDGDGHLVPLDCDDANAAVHPGVPEACGNDVDDDCDGRADGCGPGGATPLAHADARVLAPEYGHLGWRMGDATGLGDLDGDGTDDLALRASALSENQTAVWLLPAPLTSVTALDPDDAALRIATVGVLLAGGDLDGDGLGDLVVTGHRRDTDRNDGRLYIFGSPVGGSLAPADARAVLRFDASVYAGAVEVADDIDGDGLRDVVIGDPEAQEGEVRTGAVWVIPGATRGLMHVDDVAARIRGTADVEWIGGYGLGSGDLDSDGLADVLVPTAVGIHMFLGPVSDSVVTDADAIVCCGDAVRVGDTDGDGHGDLFVGNAGMVLGDTVGLERPGAAFVFRGPVNESRSFEDAEATVVGLPNTSATGDDVLLPGDMDGDGLGELAVTGQTGWTSAVFLFPGDLAGVHFTTAAAATLYGADPYSAWHQLYAVGDTDADGFADLLVSDEGWDEDGRRGAWLLIRGGPGF